MVEDKTEAEQGRFVALQCRKCGGMFRARQWRDGVSCPNCRGSSVRPVPAPGGAVDYMLADRSQGTTADDVAFAEWAKWCGFVTANQYNTAMHRQNSELHETARTRPIHEVLASMGLLDKDKVEGLLRFLALPRPNLHDKDFVARLLRHGHADPEQVERVCRLQRRMADQNNEVRPVCQMLVHRRLITEAQMLEVLHEQEGQELGDLAVARQMAQRPPRDSVLMKLGRRVKGRKVPLRSIAVLAALLLVAYAVWSWQLRRPQIFVYGQCERCKCFVQVPWSATDWPRVCPVCRHRSVLYLVRCPKGHYYVRASPFSKEACPECGSDFGRQPTASEFAALLAAPRASERRR